MAHADHGRLRPAAARRPGAPYPPRPARRPAHRWVRSGSGWVLGGFLWGPRGPGRTGVVCAQLLVSVLFVTSMSEVTVSSGVPRGPDRASRQVWGSGHEGAHFRGAPRGPQPLHSPCPGPLPPQPSYTTEPKPATDRRPGTLDPRRSCGHDASPQLVAKVTLLGVQNTPACTALAQKSEHTLGSL